LLCWPGRQTTVPLHSTTQLCSFLLLRRDLPALEGPLTGYSAALGKTKHLIGSVEGSSGGKFERNPTARRNIWQAYEGKKGEGDRGLIWAVMGTAVSNAGDSVLGGYNKDS
jgi:hypothetical protein